MSLGIRPLSIAMPLAALLVIAIVSLISAISTLWSVMTPELHSSVVLFTIFIASMAAAVLFFVQSRGIASLLPYKLQDSLVNMSLMDAAQSVWRVTGDVIDAAVLVGLRMDHDHTERALTRLPPNVRKTITQPGLVNLLPSPVSNLILPDHIRRKFERSRAPMPAYADREPREQFLTPIILEVSERRILSLTRALMSSIMAKNPLLRLSQKHFRALMFLCSCISFFHLIRSRSYRRISFKTFQFLVFLSAMSINVMNLKTSPDRNAARPARARSATCNLIPRHGVQKSIPYSRLIIAGTSVVAIGAVYMRYRKNKRLL